MQRSGGWKAFTLIALALSSPGCFRYIPAQLEATPPGEGVRVLVTRRGAAELAEISDLVDVAPTIDGTVVGVEEQELLLRVPVGQRQDGSILANLSQTIRIPTEEIVSFHRKEFDGLATGLVLGAAAGLVTAVVVFIMKPIRGEDPDPVTPPDEFNLSLTFLSLPFGR